MAELLVISTNTERASDLFRATGLSPMGRAVGFRCASITNGLPSYRPSFNCYTRFSYLAFLRNFLFGRDELGLEPLLRLNWAACFLLHHHPNSCHAAETLYGRLLQQMYIVAHSIWLCPHYSMLLFFIYIY